MPYKSKTDFSRPHDIARGCDNDEVYMRRVPVYQLKKRRRVLQSDITEAWLKWIKSETEAGPSVRDLTLEECEYWSGHRWMVDQIEEGWGNVGYVRHLLAEKGYDYRNGKLYRRKRPLKSTDRDDLSLREAALSLKIREEEIRGAVKRGDLLSSMAAKGRRRVNQHDLEDWVRRFWTKSLWSKIGSVHGQK